MEDLISYIGCKIIQAKPTTEKQYQISKGLTPNPNEEDMPGYLVIYPDGYVSWSPKKVFEVAYRRITDEEFKMLD